MGYLNEKVILNIKVIMKQKNITYRSFQDDTGINIGRIFSEKPSITLPTVERIGDYLNTPINELIK